SQRAKVSDRARHPRGRSAVVPRRRRERQSTDRPHKQRPLCLSKCRRNGGASWVLPAAGLPQPLAPEPWRELSLGKPILFRSTRAIHADEKAWASSPTL